MSNSASWRWCGFIIRGINGQRAPAVSPGRSSLLSFCNNTLADRKMSPDEKRWQSLRKAPLLQERQPTAGSAPLHGNTHQLPATGLAGSQDTSWFHRQVCLITLWHCAESMWRGRLELLISSLRNITTVRTTIKRLLDSWKYAVFNKNKGLVVKFTVLLLVSPFVYILFFILLMFLCYVSAPVEVLTCWFW